LDRAFADSREEFGSMTWKEDSIHRAFFGPEAWSPLAEALVAYAAGDTGAELKVYVDDGEVDPLPISLFFRAPSELRDVDRMALEHVEGRVLDVGAGVGSVALTLQKLAFEVTAVEVIPEAVDIMSERGVRDARAGRIEDLPEGEVFDTILVLMNGIALAGSLAGVPGFLKTLRNRLEQGGQVLLDSTDLLDGNTAPGDRTETLPPHWNEGDYPGEVHYQLEFQGKRGAPFPQVFVDPDTLAVLAQAEGFDRDVIWRGPDGAFLARLRKTGDRQP
jgi:SAM-dependent methyltransferase